MSTRVTDSNRSTPMALPAASHIPPPAGLAMPARRGLLLGLALGAAGASGQLLAQPNAEPAPQPRPWPAGRPTPALELPAWEGPTFRLADARGKVVVLNFWASWCEPCRAEMPSLELLETRFEKDGLIVRAVNFRETDGTIRRFLQQSAIGLTILRDADGAAARAWQVRIYPTTVVIGRNGRARFSVVGEVDWTSAQARQWITAVL